MDIRSFFGGGKPKTSCSSDEINKGSTKNGKKKKEEAPSNRKKTSKKRTLDSDSDEEPLPQKLRKTNSSKRTVIEDSDDDDIIIVTKKKKTGNEESQDKSDGKKQIKEKKKMVESPPKPKLQPTTAIDFFGSTPISQKTKPSLLTKAKRENKESKETQRKASPKNETEKKASPKKEPQKTMSPKKAAPKIVSPKKAATTVSSPKKGSEKREKVKPNEDIFMIDDDDFMMDDDEDFEKSIRELETVPLDNKKSQRSKTRTPEKSKPKFIEESPLPAKEKGSKAKEKEHKKSPKKDYSKKESSQKEITKGEKVSSPAKPPQAKTPVTKKKEKGDSEKKEGDATPSLEKKKSFYASYKARDGPRNLGSKEIPQGGENCLEGLSFVITGVLESIEREQASDLVKKHGGKVVTSVSKRTSYIVVGRDPGESKMSKANNFKTKQLDEDGLFDLIRQLPAKVSKYEPQLINEEEKKKGFQAKSPSTTATSESKYFKKEDTTTAATTVESSAQSQVTGRSQESNYDSQAGATSEPREFSQESQSSQPASSACSSQVSDRPAESLLWVDKYKPKLMSKIIGQQGEKSNAKKLYKWLVNWNDNNLGGEKPKGKGGFFAGKEDGSIFKCALLSGPPGVGKTTTATLVCQEAEYSFMELNASDARSKKTLQQVISEVLSNTTVDKGFFGGKAASTTGRHAVIMDEVDGMAGNEDRGGVQELISLIKNTKVPIICMCNDRNHPKIRSLANYCFDLRFYKPRVEQIKSFVMTISCREGLNVPSAVMEQIIVGANQDIRQVLHNLQMWSATKKTMTFDEAKSEAKNAEKNIKIGPFDITKKLFSASDSQNMGIQDKLDLFFNDYSFVPLFVQENYLLSNPMQSRGNKRKTLELMSLAADSLADSNIVEKVIREKQMWSLLPLQAHFELSRASHQLQTKRDKINSELKIRKGFYSCVVAPDMMRGGMGQRIEFPQWLGKNSSRGKHDRILQELKTHMRLSCFAGKSDINLDYLWHMRKSLVAPLVHAGDDVNNSARKVIELMNSYNLTREDWESFIEIGKWGSQPDITGSIPSKVKAAFTRAYNKDLHLTPYASGTVTKKKRGGGASVDMEMGEEEGVVDSDPEEEDDDITKDSMIKVKKRKPGEEGQGKTGGKGKGKGLAKNAGRGRGKK